MDKELADKIKEDILERDKRKGFRKFYDKVVKEYIWASLPPIAKAVYPAILCNVNWKTGLCIISSERLAVEAGINKESVPKATDILVKVGLITKKRGGEGIQYRYVYTVCSKQEINPDNEVAVAYGQKVLKKYDKDIVKAKVKFRRGDTGKFLGSNRTEKKSEIVESKTLTEVKSEIVAEEWLLKNYEENPD